jgi:hypothetical protein
MTDVTTTVCPYCGTGCSMRLSTQRNQIVEINGDPTHPVNGGDLTRCCAVRSLRRGGPLGRCTAQPLRFHQLHPLWAAAQHRSCDPL